MTLVLALLAFVFASGVGGYGVPAFARVLRPAGSPLTSLQQAHHPLPGWVGLNSPIPEPQGPSACSPGSSRW
ncbi:MAG: hypothetical protein EBV34_10250 [Betaproteobacteria bacterium]|nr:hypothetical protein [Betaproteobacteria bacterium]